MVHYNSVSGLLKSTLTTLMQAPVFESFRLVGGTALSLQIGHRLSIDIDLFTDAPYDSINFKSIDTFIENTFPYHHHFSNFQPALGKSYTVGSDREQAIKVDVFYTDTFIHPPLIEDGIRMATTEEIIAMKIDVVQRGGRKKDFWDLHELFTKYPLSEMLLLHQQRYPYTHDSALILQNLTHFDLADDDFDPVCLRGKYWAFIKEDIIEIVEAHLKL